MMTMVGFCFTCFSGSFPKDPRTIPVLIASDKGQGSGCLMRLSNSVYLITVKHVLFLKAEGTNLPALISPGVMIRGYSSSGATNVTERTLLLNLGQLLGAGEIRYSTNRDVAVVRIERCHTNDDSLFDPLPGVGFLQTNWGLDILGTALALRLSDVDVGSDVFMFGYPGSLTGPMADLVPPDESVVAERDCCRGGYE